MKVKPGTLIVTLIILTFVGLLAWSWYDFFDFRFRGSPLKERIVGQWELARFSRAGVSQSPDPRFQRCEFFGDGRFLCSGEGAGETASYSGRYSFESKEKMKLEFSPVPVRDARGNLVPASPEVFVYAEIGDDSMGWQVTLQVNTDLRPADGFGFRRIR